MTNLKVRVWDKVNNEFVNDDHIEIAGTGDFVSWLYEPHEGNLENRKVPETAEIQLFTGLQDKNNKEIYQGDLVRHFNFTSPFEIILVPGAFKLKEIRNSGSCPILDDDYLDIWADKLEIIGNIYEKNH